MGCLKWNHKAIRESVLEAERTSTDRHVLNQQQSAPLPIPVKCVPGPVEEGSLRVGHIKC